MTYNAPDIPSKQKRHFKKTPRTYNDKNWIKNCDTSEENIGYGGDAE